MELVRKTHTYVDKENKTKTGVNYYLVVNGNWIAIKPSFTSDYKKLQMVSSKYEDFLANNETEF